MKRISAGICLALLSLSAALCISASSGYALVVNDDPASHEVHPPSDYDMVGYHNAVGGSTGVLVSPWFVLTAGHVVDYGTDRQFTLHLESGTVTCDWADTIRHPVVDLALVRLSSNTGLGGYELYTGTGEGGMTGILVGYGMSGTGTSVGEGGDPDYPRGTKRAGTNLIDRTRYLSGVHYLQMDFDENGTDVMIGAGDSGGPTFVDIGGTLKVAGINAGVDSGDPEHWPAYGDKGFAVRVRSYAGWIQGNIPALGDFDVDGNINDQDIDLLLNEIHVGGESVWPYDLTADDVVDKDDADHLVEDILGVYYGDADLDGEVGILDLATLANNLGKSEVGWADADFNGDGYVGVLDLAIAANNYGRGAEGGGGAPATPAGGQVPAPPATTLMVLGALGLLRRRRRT